MSFRSERGGGIDLVRNEYNYSLLTAPSDQSGIMSPSMVFNLLDIQAGDPAAGMSCITLTLSKHDLLLQENCPDPLFRNNDTGELMRFSVEDDACYFLMDT